MHLHMQQYTEKLKVFWQNLICTVELQKNWAQSGGGVLSGLWG